LALPAIWPPEDQVTLKLEYLDVVRDILRAEARLRDILADPNLDDRETASAPVRAELEELYQRRSLLAPVAEAVMENQVAATAAKMGLSLGGQPVPPVLYHTTPLPMALIISPRDVIRQETSISLLPDLTIDEQIALEAQVEEALDVSALIVGIGGIGMYPTMVMETTNLPWLAEVVAHEWIHNYLTLRPLGMNYLTSGELRTMNETAASIAGKEIGHALIAQYYPEHMPPPPAPAAPRKNPAAPRPHRCSAFKPKCAKRALRLTPCWQTEI
jgi:hypothetical protein